MTVGAAPDNAYVLTLTLMRVALVIYVGPCILFFGNSLDKVSTLFQAAVVNGLWAWWLSLQQIAYPGDVPPNMEELFKVLFTSGTTGFTMMVAEQLRFMVRGAQLLYTFIMQLVDLVEVALVNWAGCDAERYKPGLALRGQRYDAWVGCGESGKYYGSMWIIKLLEWSSILIGAVCAKLVAPYIKIAAASMIGAELVASGVEAFIADVYAMNATPEEVGKLQVAFVMIRVVICNVLFGVGCLIQFTLMKKHDHIADYHKCVRPIARAEKCISAPLQKLEDWLSNGCNNLTGAGKKAVENAAELAKSKTEAYLNKVTSKGEVDDAASTKAPTTVTGSTTPKSKEASSAELSSSERTPKGSEEDSGGKIPQGSEEDSGGKTDPSSTQNSSRAAMGLPPDPSDVAPEMSRPETTEDKMDAIVPGMV